MVNLQKGLVGHWTMDDRDTSGGVLYDKSAYNIHMAVDDTSAISTVSANIGDGIYFSNSGSTATNVDTIPDNLGNKIKDSCSISFWAKDISFTGNDSYDAWVIRSSGDNIDKSIGVFGGREGERFIFERRDESGNFQGIRTTTTSWGSEWHHIVCQFSTSNNNREIWVDSELERTNANNFQATSDFTGLDISFGGLDGKLDDVRLYSRTLSESEINALYQMRSQRETTSSLSKGLIGHWTMDDQDINSGTIYDKSGNSNNLQTDSSVTTGVPGKVGTAISTDGTGGTTSTNSPQINQHTLMFWIKPSNSSSNSYEPVIENGSGSTSDDGTGGRKPLVTRSNDNLNIWHWRISTSSGGNDGVNSSATLDVGSWSHWAGVHTDGNFTLYKNGQVSDDISVASGFSSGYGDFDMNFGQMAYDIDDVRFYNRGLSQKEIKRIYNKR